MTHASRPLPTAKLARSSADCAPGPSQTRQTLKALVASVVVLAVAATLLFLIHLRDIHLKAAEAHAVEFALLLEKFVERTFGSADFVAGKAAAMAQAQPLAELARSREAWNDLRALTLGLPETGTLWIADREGNLILGSLGFPAPPLKVDDRHYFQAHLTERRERVIGPLVTAKTRGTQAFHLSRRIEDKDGGLIGVAVVGIDAIPFTDVHRTLNRGENARLIVVDADGRVIMHQPHPEDVVGSSMAGDPAMLALADQPHGVVHGPSELDGIERISAYRTVKPYGVVVVTSIAVADVLAPWWSGVWASLGFLLVIFLILGTLAAFAFRSLSREEAMMSGLEAAVLDRTEEARRNAADALAANESKTKFLAAASHDLRQPLQAAGMFVEALAVRLDGSSHMPVIDRIRQSLDSTQALLNMLLDISTLEAGRVTPNPCNFPLAPLLLGLVEQMEPSAAARNLKLRLAPTSAWVHSDPVLLERILRNLLVNALRYTTQGGVLIGCRPRGAAVVVQIVDSGAGIAADKLDMVFEEFTRLHGPGGSSGLGLGLAVVRRTAKLLDHAIEVKSRLGKGSSFGIVVPLAIPPQSGRVSNGVAAGSASPRVSAANTAPSAKP